MPNIPWMAPIAHPSAILDGDVLQLELDHVTSPGTSAVHQGTFGGVHRTDPATLLAKEERTGRSPCSVYDGRIAELPGGSGRAERKSKREREREQSGWRDVDVVGRCWLISGFGGVTAWGFEKTVKKVFSRVEVLVSSTFSKNDMELQF